MKEVVIVGGVRTAIGRRKGSFCIYRPDELAAVVLEELMKRAGVNKADVEDVILGCVTQSGEQGGNIARTAALYRWLSCTCARRDNRPTMRIEPTSCSFRFPSHSFG